MSRRPKEPRRPIVAALVTSALTLGLVLAPLLLLGACGAPAATPARAPDPGRGNEACRSQLVWDASSPADAAVYGYRLRSRCGLTAAEIESQLAR